MAVVKRTTRSRRRVALLTRHERASATRQRIVQVAARLFAERGYAGTTIAAIAREAEVAVQTVYFVFHTKTELLAAVADLAITGGLAPDPSRIAWMAEALAEPDPARRLARVVAGFAEIIPRMLPVLAPWQAAIAADPRAAEVYRERLLSRRSALRRIVDVTAQNGQLRAGLTPERATDIFFALTTPESYETYTRLLGWSISEWRSWVVTALERELLR
jgi:AcrR family transcriptional regulator